MPEIDLYYAPGACSLVSHIALEEAGLRFTPHALAFMAGEHKAPGYLAINPAGKVPTLVVNGRPLVETLAILSWIDQRVPEAMILPKPEDSFDEFQDLSLVYWFAATVHPVFTRFRVPPAIIDDPASFQRVAACAAPVLANCFEIAAARLDARAWLLGDWSIADAYLFWLWTEALAGGFDGANFPTLITHAERVAARPATQRALAREAVAVGKFVQRGVAMPGKPGR
jgi:glutathione S-transferase